jgi:hypothetical protein
MKSVEQTDFSDTTGLLWNDVLENVGSQAGEGCLGLLDSILKYDHRTPESRNMVFCPLTPAGAQQHGQLLYRDNLTPSASSPSTTSVANLSDKSPTAKVGDDITSVIATQSSKARVCLRERAKIRQARYHGNINDSVILLQTTPSRATCLIRSTITAACLVPKPRCLAPRPLK